MDDQLNESMNYEAVCRTVPATPGLLSSIETKGKVVDTPYSLETVYWEAFVFISI